MLSQWHVKDPGHSTKSAGGRLQISMHTSLTQQSRSGPTVLSTNVGTNQENELTRNSSRNSCPLSSHLAEPLWTDPGRQSGTGALKLISTSKEEEEARAGNDSFNLPPKVLACEKEATNLGCTDNSQLLLGACETRLKAIMQNLTQRRCMSSSSPFPWTTRTPHQKTGGARQGWETPHRQDGFAR